MPTISDPALIPTGTEAQERVEKLAARLEAAGWTVKVDARYFPGVISERTGRMITNSEVFYSIYATKGPHDGALQFMWKSVAETSDPTRRKSTRRVMAQRVVSGKVRKMRSYREMSAWLRTLGI
jgi:hypothetical protein